MSHTQKVSHFHFPFGKMWPTLSPEKQKSSWNYNENETLLNLSLVTDSSRRGSASDLPDIGLAFSLLSFLPMTMKRSTSMEACKQFVCCEIQSTYIFGETKAWIAQANWNCVFILFRSTRRWKGSSRQGVLSKKKGRKNQKLSKTIKSSFFNVKANK